MWSCNNEIELNTEDFGVAGSFVKHRFVVFLFFFPFINSQIK